jgi:hypothetical protein
MEGKQAAVQRGFKERHHPFLIRQLPGPLPLDRFHGSLGAERRVWAASAQQPLEDGMVHFKCARQQRPSAVAFIALHVQQFVPAQRGLSGERVQAVETGWAWWAEDLQREVNARSFTGHVVLQVGVNALVPQVEAGRQRKEQHLALEFVQAERLRQVLKAGA